MKDGEESEGKEALFSAILILITSAVAGSMALLWTNSYLLFFGVSLATIFLIFLLLAIVSGITEDKDREEEI